MNIIWAITGAGHLLRESVQVLEEVSEEHEITLALSKAAEEVITLYGLNNKIENILNKNDRNTQIFEDEEKYSYPFSGKITHNRYDCLIVAPATANTVAKIVHAIADTLVTNMVAQSGKGGIPTIILPVDIQEGPVETVIPPHINAKTCRKCDECKSRKVCPQNAIKPPHIDTIRCTGCMQCRNSCPYNALITDKKIELYIRKIDAENTKNLEKIENITVVTKPWEIKDKIGKKDS